MAVGMDTGDRCMDTHVTVQLWNGQIVRCGARWPWKFGGSGGRRGGDRRIAVSSSILWLVWWRLVLDLSGGGGVDVAPMVVMLWSSFVCRSPVGGLLSSQSGVGLAFCRFLGGDLTDEDRFVAGVVWCFWLLVVVPGPRALTTLAFIVVGWFPPPVSTSGRGRSSSSMWAPVVCTVVAAGVVRVLWDGLGGPAPAWAEFGFWA
ncbi:hypothetical protein RHMOL_Rhmol04G0336100 [Rhododendron molle]|uniref:Uncharacterized protein n=1 Tax=Rhododendron molle TaxID=49168 RepID=A0ACC0P6U1_RHOML|nr:hypothetical protein RHMOL_Rhmol04G0336100 [Rhododendron molle]